MEDMAQPLISLEQAEALRMEWSKPLPEEEAVEVAQKVEELNQREAPLDRDKWSTPERYVDLVREILGEIDLDPATNLAAQEVVKATRFYTSEDDGLTRPWFGKVWLNPPYSQPACKQFTERLLDHLESGEVSHAVVLVNTSTASKWYQRLLERASLIIFPKGRIQFWHPDMKEAGDTNRYDQTFLVFAPEHDLVTARAEARFKRMGWQVVAPRREELSQVERYTLEMEASFRTGQRTLLDELFGRELELLEDVRSALKRSRKESVLDFAIELDLVVKRVRQPS